MDGDEIQMKFPNLKQNLVTVSMPVWVAIFVGGIPCIAYIDYIVVGGVSIKHYAIASGLEVLLIFIGFTIAVNTVRREI